MDDLQNPYNYKHSTDEAGIATVENDTAELFTLIDAEDLQAVLNQQWFVDDDGYYTLLNQQKVAMPNYLLKLPPDIVIKHKDKRPFDNNCKDNFKFVQATRNHELRYLKVEETEVIVSASDYYDKSLYMLNLKLYRGYVVFLVKRRRIFLHQYIMDGGEDVKVRYRFRDGNKLNCSRENIKVSYLL